ncbi:MAG: GAF domain-containing protein [Endomicrobia bacterium]|nr:GAF domain-containing protein [Endomicrobiia bacterium]
MEKTELKTLVSLYEDTSRLFSHLNLKDLLSATTAVAKKLTRCAEVHVFLTNDEGRLYLASSLSRSNLSKKELSDLPVYSFFSGTEDYYDEPKKEISKFVSEIYLNDAKRDTPMLFDADFAPEQYRNIFVNEFDIRSILLYPIALNGKITGYVFMAKDSRSSSFVRADLKKVSALVSQISQAVYNAQVFERLESNVLKYENSTNGLKSLPNDSL